MQNFKSISLPQVSSDATICDLFFSNFPRGRPPGPPPPRRVRWAARSGYGGSPIRWQPWIRENPLLPLALCVHMFITLAAPQEIAPSQFSGKSNTQIRSIYGLEEDDTANCRPDHNLFNSMSCITYKLMLSWVFIKITHYVKHVKSIPLYSETLLGINLFTTIHDGNFRRHSSMNVTIKWHKFSSNIYYIYVFFVIWSWKLR